MTKIAESLGTVERERERESNILKTTIFSSIVDILLCENKVNKLRVKAMYFRRM